MRLVRVLTVGLVVAAAVGCGGGDPNKGLKPIDPNAARPTQSMDGKPASDTNAPKLPR